MSPMRYEYGIWPRWRVDRNARYQLKGLFHVPHPESESDRQHFHAMSVYLAKRRALAPATENARSLSIAAVGDLMWTGRDYSDYLSADVRRILDRCDLRLVNLETPIDTTAKVPAYTYDLFNASPQILDPWVADGKPGILSICNNHALDMGDTGPARTREAILAHEGARCVGGLEQEDAHCLIDLPQARVAAFGMTFGFNRPTKKRKEPAGIPVVSLGDPNREPDWEMLQRLIDRCRAASPDLVVLMAHWGFEYEYWPTELQRRHAYRLIEMGVDLLIGSSPHLLQPLDLVSVNRWDEKSPVQLEAAGEAREGIIAYSLGNFLTRMGQPACRAGAILEISYSWDMTGRRSLDRLSVYPTLSVKENGRCRTITLEEYRAQGKSVKNIRRHARRAFHGIIDNSQVETRDGNG
jgi:poly-gamma-glutamate capsule biosynthesis protein CapA/YwtB (metallophosphatase superfamily)